MAPLGPRALEERQRWVLTWFYSSKHSSVRPGRKPARSGCTASQTRLCQRQAVTNDAGGKARGCSALPQLRHLGNGTGTAATLRLGALRRPQLITGKKGCPCCCCSSPCYSTIGARGGTRTPARGHIWARHPQPWLLPRVQQGRELLRWSRVGSTSGDLGEVQSKEHHQNSSMW